MTVFRMSGKRSRSFKCAVHHRDRQVASENDFHLLFHEPPIFNKLANSSNQFLQVMVPRVKAHRFPCLGNVQDFVQYLA
ncbi:hypothetical protein E2C01_064755 [Portunus trituberculatus]|uniref:Uncharacterized protein n=1 Tax=Portunus trituberculatus TaxID=210409 RepID=A0A5B7HLP8_PORTR|nr:hypothetical protein [Portunus trituberculatus]